MKELANIIISKAIVHYRPHFKKCDNVTEVSAHKCDMSHIEVGKEEPLITQQSLDNKGIAAKSIK